MPTTRTQQQERWNEIVRDPALRDLPYKIETNERGQILLSPHTNGHSFTQDDVQALLREHAPEGSSPPEFAIATPKGTKSPDVVWMSNERRRAIIEAGDPTTVAPEICVEVMSETNTEAEMQGKAELYFEAGAEEVWIVDVDGWIRFFNAPGKELNASGIATGCPDHI